MPLSLDNSCFLGNSSNGKAVLSLKVLIKELNLLDSPEIDLYLNDIKLNSNEIEVESNDQGTFLTACEDCLPERIGDSNCFLFLRATSNNTVLLELNKNTLCKPACKKGICYSGQCKCKNGYMGRDCSVKEERSSGRVSLLMLILMFVGVVVVAIILAYVTWLIFSFCSNPERKRRYADNIVEVWE